MPASDAAAAKEWGLNEVPPSHWLIGTPAELGRVRNEYHIDVGPPPRGDVPRTEALYVIDSHGDEGSGYLYSFASRFVTHALTVGAPGSRN